MNALSRLAVAACVVGCTACPPRCPVGLTDCDGVCIDVSADRAHCGACDTACPRNGVCVAGGCACPDDAPQVCGNTCVDTQSNAAHCGTCGHACGLGTCVGGMCVCASRPTSIVHCVGSGAECVDIDSDSDHCSGCGLSCRGGKRCVGGACACPSSKPDECAGACTDVLSNPAHCGACDRPCTTQGSTCLNGTCGCPSTAPVRCAASDTCSNTASDVANCGGCGRACTRAWGTCTAGVCGCPPERPDFCPALKACVNLATDVSSCGACGFRCSGGSACVDGTCCGDGGVVCSGTCCPGGACCAGNTCPLRHANGLGGQFFDCNPLGIRSEAQARSAADAWKPGVDTSGFPCGNTTCLRREAADQCALFCADGRVTTSAVGSLVCLCEGQGPAVTASWN